MTDHDVMSLVFTAIMVIGVIASGLRRLGGNGRRSRAERAAGAPAKPLVTGPSGVSAPGPVSTPPPAPAVRRRLAPPQAVRPIMPPVVPATSSIFAPAADLAAAAFPQLDLTLPSYEGIPGTAEPRRRFRSPGGGPAIGSPAWAANAVVAAEIMGPPVSLRPGATLGAPHAF